MKRNERTVGARLPASLVDDLEQIERIEQLDRSSVVRRLLSQAVLQWKLNHYAQQYGRGAVTAGRAAEECGVSLWEMLEYLRAHQIPSPYDLRELEHDLGVMARRLRSKEEG